MADNKDKDKDKGGDKFQPTPGPGFLKFVMVVAVILATITFLWNKYSAHHVAGQQPEEVGSKYSGRSNVNEWKYYDFKPTDQINAFNYDDTKVLEFAGTEPEEWYLNSDPTKTLHRSYIVCTFDFDTSGRYVYVLSEAGNMPQDGYRYDPNSTSAWPWGHTTVRLSTTDGPRRHIHPLIVRTYDILYGPGPAKGKSVPLVFWHRIGKL
jgi:hypothetical protein